MKYPGIAWMVIMITVVTEAGIRHVPADYPTIQAAIDASISGDTIYIADGIYTGPGNVSLFLNGKSLHIESLHGADMTVIDCQGTGSAFILNHSEPSGTVISGLTLTGADGGAMIVWTLSAPTIQNCIITDNNNSTGKGAGIWCFNASPIIYNCIITSNSSNDFGYGAQGAGIYSYEGNPRVINCRIESNCIKMRNDATDKVFAGAGVFHQGSGSELSNCLIEGNDYLGDPGPGSHTLGGAVSGSWTIRNCTIVNNDSPGDTGGVDGSSLIESSILYFNTGNQVIPGLTASYCDIEGGYPGAGNLNSDPLFIAGPKGAHYLSQIDAGQGINSPCLNNGLNNAVEDCFNGPDGSFCLSDLSTRSDESVDTLKTDIGYHYEAAVEPTATPSPSETPSPTETPTPSDWTGVNLSLSQSSFEAGDRFLLEASFQFHESHSSADLYVVLEVVGWYYFYPSWSENLDYETVDFPGLYPGYREIFDFVWPEGNFGNMDGLSFWGLITSEGTYDVIGEIDHLLFGYH